MRAAPVILAAGGTGGHVFPAQALAEELMRRDYPLALVTDHRGEGYGEALGRIDTFRISAARVGGGVRGRLRGLAGLGVGYFQVRRILARLAPVAVVGFGGYPSVPTVLAATARRLPTMIHEQNAVLGRANRLLAGRVSRIATSFAGVARIRPADRPKIVLTGNPVRAAFETARAAAYPAVDGDTPLRLLVFGGSQGARVLSDVVPAAIARMPEALRRRLAITQQCRKEDLERVADAYRQSGVAAELAPFFDDVPGLLARSHLVISRAGASTVAELAEAGRPAILVPYPAATDDHQTANARALAEAGGAWLMPQPGFTAEALGERLTGLATAPHPLTEAAAAARRVARPDSASRLADAVVELIGDAGGGRHRGAAAREKVA